MRTDLCVRAVHHGEMRVDVHVREHLLAMDYPAEGDRNPTPLELLMASLAACAANTLNLVLSKKMGVRIDSLEVEARAERRAEHPTVLTDIELVYRLGGEHLDSALIDRAMRIAEDQLCPVLAMLRPGTRIKSHWQQSAAYSFDHAGNNQRDKARESKSNPYSADAHL
jgi:putative redox protein